MPGFATTGNESLVPCLGDPQTAHTEDSSPLVRKKADWFTPGGTIYQRTVPRSSRQRNSL